MWPWRVSKLVWSEICGNPYVGIRMPTSKDYPQNVPNSCIFDLCVIYRVYFCLPLNLSLHCPPPPPFRIKFVTIRFWCFWILETESGFLSLRFCKSNQKFNSESEYIRTHVSSYYTLSRHLHLRESGDIHPWKKSVTRSNVIHPILPCNPCTFERNWRKSKRSIKGRRPKEA